MPRSGSLWGEFRATLERAERWLLPGACLVCGEPIRSFTSPNAHPGAPARGAAAADDPLLCGPCLNRLAPLPSPQCPRCGQPLTPGIACRLCAEWPARFAGVRSAVWLDDSARRVVHLLKYEGWWRIADVMAAAMLLRLKPPLTHLALVPIPLSASRERSRGYNQSAMLAQALATRTGWEVCEPLRRARDTGTQTALTPEQRRANLMGAFLAKGRVPAHSVLVDDVFTTGATLAEAASVLLEAGAAMVSGVTFARAMRPLAAEAAAARSR